MKNCSFRILPAIVALAATVAPLALLLCSPRAAHAQIQTSSVFWDITQKSDTTIVQVLTLKQKTINTGGFTAFAFAPPQPANGFVYSPVYTGPVAIDYFGSLTRPSYGRAFTPSDTGDQVTPGTITVTVDLAALAVVNYDTNYINEDGTWNSCPYAATATAPCPPGYVDVPPPAGIASGGRGGAPQGYIYYWDYATAHTYGTWSYFGPLGGHVGGPLHYMDTAELTHTQTADCIGTYANICVCNQSNWTYAFVEARRKKKGVTGAKTGRYNITTSFKHFRTLSANNYLPSQHGEQDFLCSQNPQL